MATKNAVKRYYMVFVPSMALYLITLFGFVALRKAETLSSIWPVLLSLIPGLCVLWFMWGHWRFLKECDEMHRKVHTEGMLIALFLALGISTTIGIVEMLTETQILGIFWVFPGFYLTYGLASIIISRRYGVSCLL